MMGVLWDSMVNDPLYAAFIVVGIILVALIILWIAMGIVRVKSAKKGSMEREVRGLFTPSVRDDVPIDKVIRNNNQAVAAAIAGAICAVSDTPKYNIQIKSFKRVDSA